MGGNEVVLIVLIVLIPCVFIYGTSGLVVAYWLNLRAKAKLAENKPRPFSTAENLRFDIFLSYSAKDRPEASQLAKQIEESQLRVFFAHEDLEGGSPFTEEIRNALHDSREVWLLATPDSVNSVWVATEWGTAWALQKRIVPILLNTNVKDLPDRLQTVQVIKLSDIAVEIIRMKRRLQIGDSQPMKKHYFPLWLKVLALVLVTFLLFTSFRLTLR